MKKTLMSFVRIIRGDFIRAFCSWRFLVSILLGTGVCYLTVWVYGNYKSATLHKFILIHDMGLIFPAYIVGALPYALCVYDDFCHGNIRNMLGRTDVRQYFLSKNLTAALAGVAAFTAGKMLFVGLYSINNIVCNEGTLSMLNPDKLYFALVYQGNYVGYFLVTSLHKALYCGILCQLVLLVSMLIPNRAVVYTVPLAVFYLFHFYINQQLGSSMFNLTEIFDGVTTFGMGDVMQFCYALLIAVILFCLLYQIGLYVLRKKVFQ